MNSSNRSSTTRPPAKRTSTPPMTGWAISPATNSARARQFSALSDPAATFPELCAGPRTLRIKIAKEKTNAAGAHLAATGHPARISQGPGRWSVSRDDRGTRRSGRRSFSGHHRASGRGSDLRLQLSGSRTLGPRGLRANHVEHGAQASTEARALPTHGGNPGGIAGPASTGPAYQSCRGFLGELVVWQRASTIYGFVIL